MKVADMKFYTSAGHSLPMILYDLRPTDLITLFLFRDVPQLRLDAKTVFQTFSTNVQQYGLLPDMFDSEQ